MSNDLISRSALLQIIQEDKEFLQKGLGGDAKYAYMTADSVIWKIKSMPVAYDADKVMERLEEDAKYFQSEADELEQTRDFGAATEFQGKAAAYRDTVEIVKSGCIE